MIDISEKLVKLRITNGKDQRDIANTVGVSSKLVSKWEQGNLKPDQEDIVNILDFYDMELAEAFKDESLDLYLKEEEKTTSMIDYVRYFRWIHISLLVFPFMVYLIFSLLLFNHSQFEIILKLFVFVLLLIVYLFFIIVEIIKLHDGKYYSKH